MTSKTMLVWGKALLLGLALESPASAQSELGDSATADAAPDDSATVESALSDSTAVEDERTDLNADPTKPSAMAEAGIGLLSLPGAALCSNLDCVTGDESLMLEAWQLVRPRPKFALGAGVTLGIIPTSDLPPAQSLNPSQGDEPPTWIHREHTRGYFTAEGIGRYYPLTGATTEAWLGVTSGLVLVSDTFRSAEDVPEESFVGPRGVTLRTEGLSLGLAAGAAYAFHRNWFVGGSARYATWLLPNKPVTSAFADKASLTGRVSAFIVGITLAYRVPL